MNIVVCVKRVPHTATKVRIGPPEAGSRPRAIQLQGVEFTMSPYDEIALAEAVRLKEAAGAGTITAVSLGTDDAQQILRTALAMGADAAILLRAPAPIGLELDGFQVASALASALKEQPLDLLFFGRLAADDQGSQVGTITARLLGIPSVADVTRVELESGRARFHHLVDGRVEVVECRLPAAMTAQKGLVEPRYPSIKQIMTAKQKRLDTIEARLPAPALEVVALEPPPPRKPGRFVGTGPEAVPELLKALREEAKVL